jgi:UPF0755 protein
LNLYQKILLISVTSFIGLVVFFIFLATFTSPILKTTTIVVSKNTSINHVLDSLNNNSSLDNLVASITDVVVSLILRREPFSQELVLKKDNNFINLSVQIRTRQPLATVKITIPEGKTMYEVASIFKNKLSIDSTMFVSICSNKEFIDSLKIKAPTLEGYLYPNTYEFYKNSSEKTIIKRLVNQFKENRDFHFPDLAEDKLHYFVTLASIVEAETPVETERPRVAGVYQNRLEKGMKLEADPTVQYAIGSKKRLLYSDLEVQNPYNTYKYKGLPPGPINSPRVSSILAAISPEKHSYIFFVARGDNSNLHYFSSTYSQHLESVALYRARKK